MSIQFPEANVTGNMGFENSMQFVPYIGDAYKVYKGFKKLYDIRKGFKEGGFKGGIKSYISSTIPFSKSLFGDKKGGQEGRMITSAATQVIGNLDKTIKDMGDFQEARGTGNRDLQGLYAAYENLIETRNEFKTPAANKGHAWQMIGKATDVLNQFNKIRSQITPRGRGGIKIRIPTPETGLAEPRQVYPGEIPLSGIAPIVDASSRAVRTEQPIEKSSPYTARRSRVIDELERILGG